MMISHQEKQTEPQEFRYFLQEELVRRCKKNPRFSLRAFARTLDVEASALSKILSGKRTLTRKMLYRMAGQLGLDPKQIQAFEQNLLPSSRLRSSKAAENSKFQQLTLDAFNVISDWYHYAILELISLNTFQPSPAWIARALGISVAEANLAIERLIRLGMLEITDKNEWVQKAGQLTTIGNKFTASAFRKHQKQILNQAIEAMDKTPIEMRDQTSMTMAINAKYVEAAKEKIKNFRRELCSFLQKDPQRDEVYQLSISFFPVSRAHEINQNTKKPDETT